MFKEFLKAARFGSMAGDGDAEFLVGDYGYEGMMRSTVTNLLLDVIAPWLSHCFMSYTEDVFHEKMLSGFDFLADWETNHAERFNKILKYGQRLRRYINLDPDRTLVRVEKMLQKHQWTLYDAEKLKIRETIVTLKKRLEDDDV